ncbi:hypothetical protein GUJ93_ZPchr0002g24211 [Zizania palustris]|uniref:Uncharacterized protein n=1 Tax=Zizania palustris TaxID=103762 RepID=A0A8J5RVH4_ZIZPA|nr:hypothetical protein GUJ93_ZPchr0002g24211 [Zizania palustris]
MALEALAGNRAVACSHQELPRGDFEAQQWLCYQGSVRRHKYPGGQLKGVAACDFQRGEARYSKQQSIVRRRETTKLCACMVVG